MVAANEGIKPQTVEHLDIAGLLGLRAPSWRSARRIWSTPAQAEAVGRQAAALAEAAGMQSADRC